MSSQMYNTSYARSYGYARSGQFAQAGLAATQPLSAPVTYTQEPQRSQEMAVRESQELYDYSAQPAAQNVTFPYQARFPPRVATPSKTDFWPQGTRLGYAKGRKTYKQTANYIPYPEATPEINFNPMTRDQQASKNSYGKQSVSRRLPARTSLRYHIPGYMGHVADIQFKHGKNFGNHTRECIMTEYL